MGYVRCFVYLIHVWSLHQVCVEIKLQIQVLINNLSGQSGLSLPLVLGQFDWSDWNSAQQLRDKFVRHTGVPTTGVPYLPGELDVDWDGEYEDWREGRILLIRGQRETRWSCWRPQGPARGQMVGEDALTQSEVKLPDNSRAVSVLSVTWCLWWRREVAAC